MDEFTGASDLGGGAFLVATNVTDAYGLPDHEFIQA
jgi:hypothetical protein